MLLLLFLLCSALFVFWGTKKKSLLSNVSTMIGLTIPIILETFRNVGTDTVTYQNLLFTNYGFTLKQLFSMSDVEPLNSVFYRLSGGNTRLYFFFFAVITIPMMYQALKYFSKGNSGYLSLSYFLYLMMFFPVSMNTMREYAALSVVVWAYQFAIKKEPAKYFGTIILASCLHMSALIALPVYFICRKRKNGPNWIAFIAMASLLLLITFHFSSIFTNFSQLNVQGVERYGTYATSTGNVTGNPIFFIYMVIYAVVFTFIRRMDIDSKTRNFIVISLILGLFGELTGFKSLYIKRIAVYFDIMQIILISRIPYTLDQKNQQFILKVLLILFGIVYFLGLYGLLQKSQVLPYSMSIDANHLIHYF